MANRVARVAAAIRMTNDLVQDISAFVANLAAGWHAQDTPAT